MSLLLEFPWDHIFLGLQILILNNNTIGQNKFLLHSDNYQKTLDYISKERGVSSNDGDKLVDKYSGYIIKYKELDIRSR